MSADVDQDALERCAQKIAGRLAQVIVSYPSNATTHVATAMALGVLLGSLMETIVSETEGGSAAQNEIRDLVALRVKEAMAAGASRAAARYPRTNAPRS